MSKKLSSGNNNSKQTFKQFSTTFSSQKGCEILSTTINDEYKLLREIKRILDKRISLDEQYAKNLQDLTLEADHIKWPGNMNSISLQSRDTLLQWSNLATKISLNVEQFKQNYFDYLLKKLIEEKCDSKKFFDEQINRYRNEHRKAQNAVIDAEKRYSEEAKTYAAKNNELTKAQNNRQKNDDSRMKNLVDSIIEKRGNLYRAHNEYVFKIEEYNFIDEQYVQNIKNLLQYLEESQLILNKPWQKLFDGIVEYLSNNHYEPRTKSKDTVVSSIDPNHCYDSICENNANIPQLRTQPQVFNEELLLTSGVTKLKANRFIVDSSTKQNLKEKIEKLTADINEPIPKTLNENQDKQSPYYKKKNSFELEQLIICLKMKKKWEEKLRNKMREIMKDVGYRSDDQSDSENDENLTDRLEDQLYFHGVLPRKLSANQLIEKGDYLVRINEQGNIVLSILWTDLNNSNNLQDVHFIIKKTHNMYSLQPNGISKATVSELLTYYKRKKLAFREDGIHLIRPIVKPDYVINNDEIRTLNTIGKGHFGKVVRGEYRSQTVAVKILQSTTSSLGARERQNFINEALLLKQYTHKNIVKFLGIAAIRDPLMIIMELIEQGSLSNYLKENNPRDGQLIQMCLDIAKGMKYLENCNVIHRDLATRNCLVDKKCRIKVADFGLSRCLEADENYFSKVEEFPVRWWSIEAFSNTAPYTSKSDVWSFGVTVWEIFSKAEMPYSHIEFNHDVIDRVKAGERLQPPAKCPSKIAKIMFACWTFNPNDRPSFEKLVELIRKEKHLI